MNYLLAVQEVCYTSLNKILGSEIVNYNLREDNHWQPDFDELEKMDLSRVKICLLYTSDCQFTTETNKGSTFYQHAASGTRNLPQTIYYNNRHCLLYTSRCV